MHSFSTRNQSLWIIIDYIICMFTYKQWWNQNHELTKCVASENERVLELIQLYIVYNEEEDAFLHEYNKYTK